MVRILLFSYILLPAMVCLKLKPSIRSATPSDSTDLAGKEGLV